VNPTTDIDKTYKKLLEREEDTKAKLAEAREKLEKAREADVEALAQAALAGEAAPKRTEIALRHKVDDLSVLLDGLDEAVWKLQLEARAVVGKTHSDFKIFIPPGVPVTHADVVEQWKGIRPREEGESDEHWEQRVELAIPRNNLDAESIVAEAHRRRELSLDRRLPRLTERPASLSTWIESAYDAEDRKAEDGYERLAKKQRKHEATEAVNRAKREHIRRGHEAGTFTVSAYPEIVLPEHLAEFEPAITRSPFSIAREAAREAQLPSFEEAQNEPVAGPQPVNEAAELRQREIAGIPPVAAPDVKPINPDADLPPEERAAARAARIAPEEAA
jgi:hypothetical protein